MSKLLTKNIWVKRIAVVICAYLSVLSLGKVISLHGDAYVFWGGSYFGYNLTAVVIFGVTIWMFHRYLLGNDRRKKVVALMGGLLLAAAVVYGAYAHYVNDIFRSVSENFLQIGMVLGITVLTASFSHELFGWIQKGCDWMKRREGQTPQGHLGRYFLMVWLIIFLSYVPLFLSWWPGNFIYDAQYQLQNVVGNFHFTHHPLIHTLLMGAAYQFGEKLGDVSTGYQFYTLIQMLALSSAFAYVLLYLRKKGAPKAFRIGVLAWFALFPMHALFSITSTKDVLCAAFFLYFVVYMCRFLWDREVFGWKSYVGMIISGVLFSLFRNNALYAVILAGVIIILAIKGWKNKGRFLMVITAVFALTNVCNDILITYANAQTTDAYRETLSVPLQCLARVASYRRADLGQELYDEICIYIDEEDIARYNPYISDSVKNNANEALLQNNFLNFLKLWVKVGLQFPDEYVESIITNTMGYWYPLNQGTYVSMDISLYHTLIGAGEEIEKRTYFSGLDFFYVNLFHHNRYYQTPVLGYFFRNVTYVWLVIYYLLWCVYKKAKSGLLIGMLPAAYLCTCFLGPVVALRYIYSLIVCAPLLIYILLSLGDQKNHKVIESVAEATE